jgi:hypothetical protein
VHLVKDTCRGGMWTMHNISNRSQKLAYSILLLCKICKNFNSKK